MTALPGLWVPPRPKLKIPNIYYSAFHGIVKKMKCKCCTNGCYPLTSCLTGEVRYATPSAYWAENVGKVIREDSTIDDECWLVGELLDPCPEHSTNILEGDSVWDTCWECVCAVENLCSHCGDYAPNCYTLTLSGIQECQCVSGEDWSTLYTFLENPNKTYELQSFGECFWLAEGIDIAVSDFSNSTCSGTPDFYAVYSLIIELALDNAFWHWTTPAGNLHWRLRFGSNQVGAPEIFDGLDGFSNNCDGFILPNLLTSDLCGYPAAGPTGPIGGYGGTATLEACCV